MNPHLDILIVEDEPRMDTNQFRTPALLRERERMLRYKLKKSGFRRA